MLKRMKSKWAWWRRKLITANEITMSGGPLQRKQFQRIREVDQWKEMKIKERKETFRTFYIGFPIDETNTWGKQLESERASLAWIEGTVYQWGRHGCRSFRKLLMLHPQLGNRKRWMRVTSSHSLFYSQTRSLASGKIPPTFMMGLPSSVNLV